MCRSCREERGSPTDLPTEVDRFIELVDQLYQIHAAGGPLHVVLDDNNIDGVITPFYDAWPDEELDALWCDGWRIAELPPEAPAVVEGLGRSTRQLCDEIAAIMNGWTVEQRAAALALRDGSVSRPLESSN